MVQEVAGLPDLVVEIAFASAPGAIPVWTDVTTHVEAWSTRRGRQHELDRTEAGTGTLVLNNWDRRFEPENTGSPHSPNVVPMRRVRIRGTWEGTTHDVFHGFVEDWPPTYTEGGFQEQVTVRIVDAFEALALAAVDATYVEELSGTRVTNVLDDAGWPAADRDIDVGNSTIQGVTLADVPALTHLLDVAQSELGLLFVDRSGKIAFIERHAFFLGTEDYANHTWGDSGTEHAYKDLTLNFGVENIRNEAHVTREGGTKQTKSDSASQTKYLRRRLTRTGILVTTDAEALDQAHYLVSRYKESEVRASRLDLRPQLDPTQWPHVLHHDLGDRLRIRRRPVAGGLIEQKVFIQGISHDWRPYEWRVTWDLSPVSAAAEFWILGNSVRGVLDTTTKLGV